MIRDREILDQLVDSVRRFVRDRLIPAEADVAEEDRIPEQIVSEMKELGLYGLSIPQEYGGLGLTMEEHRGRVFVTRVAPDGPGPGGAVVAACGSARRSGDPGDPPLPPFGPGRPRGSRSLMRVMHRRTPCASRRARRPSCAPTGRARSPRHGRPP